MTSSQRLGLGRQVGMGGRETGDDGHIGATRRHTHNSHKTLRQLPASSSCSRRQAPRLDASERDEGVDPKAWRGVLLGRGSAPHRRRARDTRLGALAGRRYGASSTPAIKKGGGQGIKKRLWTARPLPRRTRLVQADGRAIALLHLEQGRPDLGQPRVISGNLAPSPPRATACIPPIRVPSPPAGGRGADACSQPHS